MIILSSLFRVEQRFKFMSACSFHWCSDNACQMQPSLHLQNLWSCLLTSTGSAKFNSCFQMGIKLGCSCFGHQNTRAQSWERVHGFITPLSDTAAICSLKDQFPFYKEFVIFYCFFFSSHQLLSNILKQECANYFVLVSVFLYLKGFVSCL